MNTFTCLPLLAVLLLSAITNVQASDSTYTNYVFPRVIESVFQPNYRRFAEASKKLTLSTHNSCLKPSAQSLLQVRDDYGSLVIAFSRIEMYRLGPMMEELHQNRLFYWPDKRRAGERQLRALISDPASAELTQAELVRKSVALQGLPALERILFGKNTENKFFDAEAPDCHLATVIAENIYSMASTMQKGWSDDSLLVQTMRQPSSDSDLYRNEREVLRRVVTQIVVGIDVVLNRKIMPLMGAHSNLKKAPLWLSDQTIPMIKANLEGIRALSIDSGLAELTNLEDELLFEFRSANTMLERLALLPRLADDRGQLTEETLSLVKTLSTVVSSIDITLNDRFLKALDINAGFNSEDGD